MEIGGMVRNMNDALKIITEYRDLLDRALEVVGDVPFYACVENEENAHLDFDTETGEAILSWIYYESDYYGGGSLSSEATRFPIAALFLSDDKLAAMRRETRADIAERDAKVRAAQMAVARDREEARDRAEFARLSSKYKKLPTI
jgi:hypothetical protein